MRIDWLETQVQSLGWEDPLEKEMTTHSHILSWTVLWTEESRGLYCLTCNRNLKVSRCWDLPGGPGAETEFPKQGAQVQSLIREVGPTGGK